MATIKAVNGRRRNYKATLMYVTRKGTVPVELTTGIGCDNDVHNAIIEWDITRKIYAKLTGRSAMHFVQSWHPNEPVSAVIAHTIGCKTVMNCPFLSDHQVIIVTHDKDKHNNHIHNHYVVNTVSYMDGHKLVMGPQDLKKLKDISDDVCIEYGLSVTSKGVTYNGQDRTETVAYNKNCYKTLKEAEEKAVKNNINMTDTDSWILNIGAAVMDAKEATITRDDFADYLAKCGILVKWSDKEIVYQLADKVGEHGKAACKIKSKKLAWYFGNEFSKEAIDNGFERAQKAGRISTNATIGTSYRRDGDVERAESDIFIRNLQLQERAAKEERQDSGVRNRTERIERKSKQDYVNREKRNQCHGKSKKQSEYGRD